MVAQLSDLLSNIYLSINYRKQFAACRVKPIIYTNYIEDQNVTKILIIMK